MTVALLMLLEQILPPTYFEPSICYFLFQALIVSEIRLHLLLPNLLFILSIKNMNPKDTMVLLLRNSVYLFYQLAPIVKN